MVRKTCMSLWFASLLASPALACSDDEAALFSCIAQDQSHTIELCGVRDEAAGGYQALRYVYGTAAQTELSFPEDRSGGRENLHFSHYFNGSIYHWQVTFANRGYGYRLYGDGDDSGVEVIRKKKRIAHVQCGERPVRYPDDIRRAASCDTGNRFGAAGCSESPPAAK